VEEMRMEKPARVVFDIETLAYPLASFDAQQQEYLLRFARTEEERSDALLKMNLSPFTARVIAVAMLNPDTLQGRVFYEHPGGQRTAIDDGLVELLPCAEEELLTRFWDAVSHYPRIITFNGRAFDGPFLMLRSAMLGVPSTRNLVPHRFSAAEHCDLLEQLTFYGESSLSTSAARHSVSGARRRGGSRDSISARSSAREDTARWRNIAWGMCGRRRSCFSSGKRSSPGRMKEADPKTGFCTCDGDPAPDHLRSRCTGSRRHLFAAS
jgi:hypothetical protein